MIERPADLVLTGAEDALFARLAEGGVIPHSALEAVLPKSKPRKNNTVNKGRPVKVVLHYLRRRLRPFGLAVVNHRQLGFELMSRAERHRASGASS